MKKHYETLGVPEHASQDEIKGAFRKKAQASHPDKGGDAEEFKEVLAAYNVLGNAEKRRRYDSGEGVAPDKPEIADLIEAVMHAVDSVGDVSRVNVLAEVKARLMAANSATAANRRAAEKDVIKRRDAARRISRRVGPNVVSEAILHEAQKLESLLRQADATIERNNKILDLLGEYVYEVDAPPPMPMDNLFGAGPFGQQSPYFRGKL